MDYCSLLSSLVVISGLDFKNTEAFAPPKQYDLDRISLSKTSIPSSPMQQKLISLLRQVSTPPLLWNPQNSQKLKLNFKFDSGVDIYPHTQRPSPLSPKNQNSPPIFTIEWLYKYAFYYPTSACVFYSLPDTDEKIEELIEELLDVRSALAQYGIHFVAVVIGNLDKLRAKVPYIRKQSLLPPMTGLLTLSNDATEPVLVEFVELLCNTLLGHSRKFFTEKQRRIKEKRELVQPSKESMVWDAHYTIKLAFCAELRDDMTGALKLFESAYDTLSLLFKNMLFKLKSLSYFNARETLDGLAIRIFLHSLPQPAAFDKFLVHLAIVDENMDIYKLNKHSKEAIRWRAFQYALFAYFCGEFKRLAPVDGMPISFWAQPGGCSLGLLWLDTAKLLIKKPTGDGDYDGYDYEQVATFLKKSLPDDDPLLDVRAAFLKSISELSGYPRTKAYALAQYGTWLESTNDSTASEQAFKSGNLSFPKRFWPSVQNIFDRKTDDEVALFIEGQNKEFPKSAIAGDLQLFKVTGLFKHQSTYAGREAKAQITLIPKFKGNLTLQWIKIVHSTGVVHIEPKEDVESTAARLVDLDAVSTSDVSLEFTNKEPRTFQIGITSLEVGEIELEEVQFQVKDSKFIQNISVDVGDNTWLTSSDISPSTVYHLKPNAESTRVQVQVRPAKLKITDDLLPIGAAGEKMKFNFVIINEEDENISPKILIKIRGGNAHERKNSNLSEENDEQTILFDEDFKESSRVFKSSESYTVSGEFSVPQRLFEVVLEVRFETANDSLPVMMEYAKEIDVVRPFRVSFDLLPEYHEQEWPAVFAPTLEIAEIVRKWRLIPSILSMIKNSQLFLHESYVTIECESGSFEFENQTIKLEKHLSFNSIVNLSHGFTCRRNDSSSKGLIPSARPLEAKATLHLKWSRESTPEIINTFTLPPLRLNLPMNEPRVLASVNILGGESSMSQVTYHLENSTPRVLNFSVSMASSTYFAFQGPKVLSIRMLPFTTKSLTYQLMPLGDAAVQHRRPLPELRVYDVNYKRTLAIQPGDKNIVFEQGTLFI